VRDGTISDQTEISWEWGQKMVWILFILSAGHKWKRHRKSVNYFGYT